ncbi:MAG TPA: PA14 domain-containing protein, partial [Acidimicrobiales bacterium]|nr:PA14 domain-containing protein [Acidimicrobiales bacterium]
DGVRVFINNTMVLERWSEGGSPADSISGSSIVLTPGTTVPIKVEFFEGSGAAGLTLAVSGPLGANGATKAVIVPPDWLAGDPGPLPAGWTLSAGPAYVGARAFEHGVTLTDAGGGLHTYAATGSGYAPPPGEDGVLVRNTDNTLTLLADEGTYVFDTVGQLFSATARDDEAAASGANTAGINYAFSTAAGRPRRLLELRDPVGARVVRLHYGNFPSDDPNLPDKYRCPNTPAGFANPPDNQLCQVEYWDGTSTFLRYNSAGQLVRIEEAGGAITDYAYGANTRLATVRDPLAYDAVAAGGLTGVADNNTSRTAIAYDAATAKVTSVTLPVPDPWNAGALAPAHSYEYVSTAETRVHVAGLTGADEPNGYNRKVTFDTAGRTLSSLDATAKATTFSWDDGDRLTSTTDPANRRSTTIYDADATRAQLTGRVSDTYGPAPATCFATTGLPNGSCAVPPPHTHTDFDTVAGVAVNGLAMVGWNNTGFGGPPMVRSLASPTSGVLLSATPPGLPSGSWSARYSGEINLAATGTYGFTLAATGGSARLFIDDALVADSAVAGGSGTRANTLAGRHRVRVDFSATAASPSLTLTWTPPGGSSGPLGAASLAPRLGHPTRGESDDDHGVAAIVGAAVYDSLERGVVSQRWTDPAALALVTTATYEAAGLRRPQSWTRPAGDVADADTATAYAYYTDTQNDVGACGQATGVNQAGLPRTTTAPSPDASANGRRVEEVLYDPAGRVKASRVNTEDWSCRTYDARGRLTRSTVPAYGGQAGHIFDYDYAVGGNPLLSKVSEGTTSMTTKVDLLGRVVSYTDVWDKTTTSTYDQAGRLTASSGPAGAVVVTYDPAGRPKTQSLDGALMATASYDGAGELAGVSYAAALNGGNGTSLSAIGRHPTGMVTALTWTGPAGTLASDVLTRSQSGKVVDETIDGTDAYPAGNNFDYDAAGRLIRARVPGHDLQYAFAATGGCGPQAAPGRNTNRTSVIDNGGPPTTYCYDNADRLVSSSDAAVGTPAYDTHGNTTTLGAQTLIYDGADRHMETKVAGATLVRYERDPTGRIVLRKEGSDPEVHYGFPGPGDSPGFVMDAANNVIERTVGLIGGVLVTKRGGLLVVGDVWSYPNVHGDVMAVADHLGLKLGTTKTYDPFGQLLTPPPPDNSAGNFDYGWLGSHQRPLEHAGTLATIEMGARQYVPSLGRFLQV